MSRFPRSKSRIYPLHVAISVVFTTLIVLFGVALIVFSFHRAGSAAVVEADRQLQRITDHLSMNVSELYGPAQNIVGLASNSVTPSSRQVLLSRSGQVVASSDPGFVARLTDGAEKGPVWLPRLSELNDPT